MGVVLAAIAGYGIIITRQIRQGKVAMPGQLLAASGVFVGCALIGEAPGAAGFASLLAWGFDVAAFMNLAPALTGGSSKKATTEEGK